MFSQDEMERELYEGRLKVERDRLTRERSYKQAMQECEEAQREQAKARRDQAEAEKRTAEAEQCIGGITRERDQAIRDASKLALVGQIQLCERLLGHGVTNSTDLQERDENALRELANRLERELTPPR